MTWFLDNAGLVGLLFFFGFFALMAIWLFMPGMKQRLEPHANIPLSEDHHDQSK